jgi:protein-S-isoprenylcysteine O-methyltransferase Ste14
MSLLGLLLPWGRIIPAPWNLSGILLLTIGVLINVLADNAFRHAETTVKPFEESTLLLTNGLYRFTRIPMYLGFVLILFGLATLLGTLLPFIVIALFAFLMEREFIVVEEGMLEQKFHGKWLDYKRNVRRWM